MSILNTEAESALNAVRDVYGRTTDEASAQAVRDDRNRAAAEAYATYVAPYVEALLNTAHRTIDQLPPAPYLVGWRAVLERLAASSAEIRSALNRTGASAAPGDGASYAALWPHLTTWADHCYVASHLADLDHRQHYKEQLTAEEQQAWTERAEAAKRRNELDSAESWYAPDGQPITLAYLVEDDHSTVVAIHGDPDAPGWRVIGHYTNEYEAGRQLPSPVPPGVLRSDASEFNRPPPEPEMSLQKLTREIIEAQTAGDAASALLDATERGSSPSPMTQLRDLLGTGAQFADALETVQGRQIGARLAAFGRQIAFLTDEVREAAEDLGATVAVLPPHRVPRPRQVRPRPAVGTTPAVAVPPRTTLARRP